MSEFCHPLRGRDEHGTVLTPGGLDALHPTETEELSRDRLARGTRLLFCSEELSQVFDDLSGWDAACWCAEGTCV
jgi:hypothetical protein